MITLVKSETLLKVELYEKEKIVDYVTGKMLDDKPEEQVRQLFEKKLVKEYGYSKDQIGIEFMIKKGSQKIGPADIVVFREDKKTFDNIYILIETKRKERRDGIDQLKSYSISPSQEFAVWFNGKEIVYFQKLPKAPYFREIPDIPKKGETLEDVGLYQKKDLKPATELKSVFETCHNYIYANEGLLKEKVFNEVLKLIFIKMVDEKSMSPKCEFRTTDKEMEEIEEGKKNVFLTRISGLFDRVKMEYGDVFDQNEKINLRPVSIAFVVSQLQKYTLIDTPIDVKGTAFQTFVYAHERGERGEFFTPYPILELATKMLNPNDNESILDPACGSGGFLVRSMIHVWKKIDKSRADLRDSTRLDMKIRYAHTYLRGIDINPDLAKVSKMHMILYDDGHTGIFAANSLDSFERINNSALKARAGEIKRESFKIIMTNPPFGTKGKVTDKTILEQYELGHKWKKDKKTREWVRNNELRDGQVPDILFIERCLHFLKDDGRMVIVLPDGDLNNTTLEYIRAFLRKRAVVFAVVSLPRETFIPHGAGTKASLIFLRKFEKKKLDEVVKRDPPIFMAICTKIGYDIRGKTIFKRNERGEYINKKGKAVGSKEEAVIDTDIPQIIADFDEFRMKYDIGF